MFCLDFGILPLGSIDEAEEYYNHSDLLNEKPALSIRVDPSRDTFTINTTTPSSLDATPSIYLNFAIDAGNRKPALFMKDGSSSMMSYWLRIQDVPPNVHFYVCCLVFSSFISFSL